ncbi:MAG: putative selenate reductase subunit YgfK [Candidatus Marinimicrobia bacterium]|nr:putative selenate reductase subunit YgfK [Candidatus Neomarinimicrobiota bacterium]
MSDKLYPLELRHLLKWILEEEKHGSIFGVTKDLLFQPKADDVFRMTRYGQLMETPIGVAAGPHTQMSQNIVLSWLMGARYIELKTIQTLDDLDVSKPCIDMQDEGYNCEWSQELRLNQSFSEYLNAWIIIHILKDKFGWGSADDLGGIFNMSAGYDLAGIKNPNVKHFLDLMENSQPELGNRLDLISNIYPNIKNLDIPRRLSDNLTLSTMHGCPPDEIEAIGTYLIEERKYHTTIKLNPTLLGPDHLRDILHNRLGYKDVTVTDEAFGHDLKYPDALNLIKSLQSKADQQGVAFGLKLTNTLEVENHKPIFPEKENMMYLSGRALHPISINLAAKLQNDFDGNLDISFSAGVDAFNVPDVLAANIKPITICTDILKPGGYTRLAQYLDEINRRFSAVNAVSIDDYILKNDDDSDIKQSGLNYLTRYAESVLLNPAYKKDNKHFETIKTDRKLTTFDCIKAPCIENCATDQEIPEYIHQVANGNFDQAYKTIIQTNPMPGVTGSVCDHLCQMKCTRNNLDGTLLIREIKRFATENNQISSPVLKSSNGLKAAIVGAGPSGLSCAYFLALDGFDVHIYEAKPFSGGMVSDAIPVFRLTDDSIKNDTKLVESVGVKIHYNSLVDKNHFEKLQQEFDYLYLGAGAQNNKKLNIEGEDSPKVVEPLTFLSKVRRGEIKTIGDRVAVIGGGNTAMDAARASRRLGAEVSIVYRRTMNEMPADIEEIVAALDEGIQLEELTAPECISAVGNGHVVLTCSKMRLGEADQSGRARPVKIEGSDFDMEFDTIIPSIGQDIAFDFLTWEQLQVNPDTNETTIPNVFAGGDVVRGASSVINAVGDGRRAALNIIQSARNGSSVKESTSSLRLDKFEYQKKLANREYGLTTPHLAPDERINFNLVTRTLTEEEARSEASRCLYCDDVCDVCVSVCPNLSNLSFFAKQKSYPIYMVLKSDNGFTVNKTGTFHLSQEPQIVNIGDFCNECGNCTTFCPTSGDPYKTKPQFHLTKNTFEMESNGYWMNGNELHYKKMGDLSSLKVSGNSFRFSNHEIEVTIGKSSLEIMSAIFLNGKTEVNLSQATDMIVLYENLKEFPIFMACQA